MVATFLKRLFSRSKNKTPDNNFSADNNEEDFFGKPFKIKIVNPEEVRMGSPYNGCEIELMGFDKLRLPRYGWQDKFAWSDDNKTLVLIRWNFENNIPGFHFYIIDVETGLTKESERIFGLVNTFVIQDGIIRYNKFLHDKEKSTQGKVCCHVEEEYAVE